MQQLIQTHKSALESFLDQRDRGVLVIRAAGEQIGYAVQILRSIELNGSPDVFLAFAHDFVSAGQFASLVVERVKATELAAREELGKAAARMPAMPEMCMDSSRQPDDRIRTALAYARSLLPRGGGKRLICAFLPMNLQDPNGYGRLMIGVTDPGGLPPWYRGMRFILREDTNNPMFAAGMPLLSQVHEMDFSPEAIHASLHQEAMSHTSPREQQAQALFQLATLDQVYGRQDEAFQRFFGLLGYYQETGNQTMQAMALIGMGDVSQQRGDLAAAKDWYESAIPAATEAKSTTGLFTLARNLGQIAFQLQNYKDAETYFDSAQKLALHVYDPEAKILSLEWCALSQMYLSAYDRARRSLTEALTVTRQFEKREHEERIANRLAQLAEVN
jgi:tetratricopeptide (TPR) repeat protein